MATKASTLFTKRQKELYKLLTSIELEVTESETRKRVTVLVDKVYNIHPTESSAALQKMERVSGLVKELKREFIHPIQLIISNYLDKIDSILNEINFESEE